MTKILESLHENTVLGILHNTFTERLDEAIDNGPKGRIKTDNIKYGQTKNMSGGTASKAELAKRREEESARKEAARAAKKATHDKYYGAKPKKLDHTSSAVHKELENHLGGTFEHYEQEPRHGYVTLPDGRKAAAMDATVTHSYTHDDLGMHPSEMHDTAETYHVRVIKHPDHGIVIKHRSHGLREDAIVE